MKMHRMAYLVALLAALLLPGCVVAPAHHGGPDVVVAPALPVVVELGVEPYYYHGGFYYYYHDRAWSYSRERAGPWRDLPRDRYPREIRYRDHERDHSRDRDDHRDR
jgi:hypothetical protein